MEIKYDLNKVKDFPGVEIFGADDKRKLEKTKIVAVESIRANRFGEKLLIPEKIGKLITPAYYGIMNPLEELVRNKDNTYTLDNGCHRTMLAYLLYKKRTNVLVWEIVNPKNSVMGEIERVEGRPLIKDVVNNYKDLDKIIDIVQSQIEYLDSLEKNKRKLRRFIPLFFPIPNYNNTGLSEDELSNPILYRYKIKR